MDKSKKIIIAILLALLLLAAYIAIRITIYSGAEGSLFVDTFPKECEVYINGEAKGKTPLKVEGLNAGEYLVLVRKEGYREEVRTVKIERSNLQKTVYIALEHLTFSLNVTSYPVEAEVYVDGVKKGTTPVVIDDILLGKHFVEIKKENFETWKKEIEATESGVFKIDALLNPSSTKLVLISIPEKAKVFINNVEKGETPFTSTEFEPGTYEIEITLTGYIPYKEKISIEKGETVKREIVLSKASTFLSIQTNPSECNVYINEELKGKTPYEEANISPGTYTLRLEKEGYLPYTTEVTIIKGNRNELSINLLKLP